MTNQSIGIGGGGTGQVTVAGGTVMAGEVNVGEQGTLTVAGGSLTVTDNRLGIVLEGTLWLTGGQLTVLTNTIGGAMTIGFFGDGQMTVSNGLFVGGALHIGDAIGSQGSLTVAGGTIALSQELDVGRQGQGALWMNGGLLIVTNGPSVTVASPAGAQMTVSNGTVLAQKVSVGTGINGQGVLTIAGGTNILSTLVMGHRPGSTGTVWMTGGQLVITNAITDTNIISILGSTVATTIIGYDSAAQMTVSGGSVQTRQVYVGYTNGASGTLTVAGGTMTATNLVLGNYDCSATGVVVVAGGSLFVTNATHTAQLEVRSGTLLVNDGTLVVDKLVATNSCAHFIQTGGTVVIGGVTNSLSGFRITSITREGNNIRLGWICGGGRTNVVQVAQALTNNFADLSGQIILRGSGDVTTNYLDIGGATNVLSRYYRVRLVP